MRRDPVLVAWVIGLGLAGLAYAVGPQYFLFRLVDYLHVMAWRLSETIGDFSLAARDLVRAMAIGLYATFVLLALAVERRGGRARGMLLFVTLAFIVLVGGDGFGAVGNTRWALALLLSGLGAVSLTNRLRQAALVARP